MSKPSKIKVGDLFKTQHWGLCEVIEYNDYKNIVVIFHNTGYCKKVRADHLLAGSVKDPYVPSVFGKGGVGEEVVKIRGKHTPSYICWHGVLERCYSPLWKKTRPTYDGCSVCEEWLFYPAFKKFYDTYYKSGFELDKDLLVKGNKLYSPTTCRFVPKDLNSVVLNRGRDRGCYKQGVSLRECDGMFVARMSLNGRIKHLGSFSTEGEAFLCYKKNKENHIREKTTAYYEKGFIDEDLYHSLLNWEIE